MTIIGSVAFEGLAISYDITYSTRRSSISIIVHRSRRVEIKAPAGTPALYIHGLAEKKSRWIAKRLKILDSIPAPHVERNYCEGEVFFFLGAPYTLKVREGDHAGTVSCDTGHLEVTKPCLTSEDDQGALVKKLVLAWYRDQATRILGDKVLEFAHILGADPPCYKVRNVRRRWGSCNHKNNLNFNTRLAMAPIGLIEYVVLHELCHIRYKNHSRVFWESVGVVMPDYRERRKLLKQEGYRYVL